MATLVLGDDQVVFLDALASVLQEHEHEVGAVARSTAEMVASVRRQRPDACLIDRHVAQPDDGQTIGRVLAASDRTSVLVLSGDAGQDAVDRALEAGASGYLHQSCGVSALIVALERMLSGEVVVDVPPARPARRSPEPDQAHRLAAMLTSRERECLLMLVEGLDTAAMVARLGVSRTTVRTHLQAVLTKLGVHSRLEAASFAVRYRLPDLWSCDDGPAAAGAAHPIWPARRGDARVARPRQSYPAAAGQRVVAGQRVIGGQRVAGGQRVIGGRQAADGQRAGAG